MVTYIYRVCDMFWNREYAEEDIPMLIAMLPPRENNTPRKTSFIIMCCWDQWIDQGQPLTLELRSFSLKNEIHVCLCRMFINF